MACSKMELTIKKKSDPLPCLARPAFLLLASRGGYSFERAALFLDGLPALKRMCNNGDFSNLQTREISMSTKIVTEADRKRTPRPALPKGMSISTKVANVSRERGPHTHHKKNPGKRHR